MNGIIVNMTKQQPQKIIVVEDSILPQQEQLLQIQKATINQKVTLVVKDPKLNQQLFNNQLTKELERINIK